MYLHPWLLIDEGPDNVFSPMMDVGLAHVRVNDLGARYMLTIDGYYCSGGIIRTKDIADKAVKDCPAVEKIVAIKRLACQTSQ